jgi:hypothetical protein
MTKLNNEFNLIDGLFTGSEARELLSTLFTDKMRFHTLKNLSHKERLGKPDAHSEERIQKLEKTHKEILDFFKNSNGGKKFEIHASITIKPIS